VFDFISLGIIGIDEAADGLLLEGGLPLLFEAQVDAAGKPREHLLRIVARHLRTSLLVFKDIEDIQ
jgi:hypothetical protein